MRGTWRRSRDDALRKIIKHATVQAQLDREKAMRHPREQPAARQQPANQRRTR
jgi:hypothetical protein